MKPSLKLSLALNALILLLIGATSPGTAAGEFSAFLPVIIRSSPWTEVGLNSATGGGISNNGSTSSFASLAFAPNGTAYVAWDDHLEIFIRSWNGSSWLEVGAGSASGGGISNTAGPSYVPSVAISAAGFPYVAWQDETVGNAEIYVRSWNGSSWVEVGGGSASGGGISDNPGNSYAPRLAFASDGTLYAAWYDDTSGDYEIYVRAWDGTSWDEVGAGSATGTGISGSSGGAFFPSIDTDPEGSPHVAWYDSSTADLEIYIRAWDGNSWAEVGPGSASAGGISLNTGTSQYPSLAIAPDGAPFVAWRDNSSGDFEIYVRTWNGANWIPVGAGSATGGGISNNDGNSGFPSLGFSPDGTLYAAWTDNTFGNDEIYVLAWLGAGWVEVGLGSASGGGISINSGASHRPSTGIAPDGTPFVAWHDSTSGNSEIYVRQHGD